MRCSAPSAGVGVPAYQLLGEKVNDETPLAWWCIDMPKEAWLAECEMAIDRGYRAVKLKGRPWRDIREQIRYLSEHLPEWFEISIDFNRMLLDGDRAAREQRPGGYALSVAVDVDRQRVEARPHRSVAVGQYALAVLGRRRLRALL